MLILAISARICNWREPSINAQAHCFLTGTNPGLNLRVRPASMIDDKLNAMRPYRGIVVLLLLGLAVVLACRPKTPPAPPIPHSVTLTWKAPDLPKKVSLVGYNIYRWTTKDSRYLRIAQHVPGPPYEDRQVTSGVTYFYAVTAVDQNGRESRLSENIQATIP